MKELYGKWEVALDVDNQPVIRRRMEQIYRKIMNNDLQHLPVANSMFGRACAMFENKQYQSAYEELGTLYSIVTMEVVGLAEHTYSTNIVIGNNVLTIIQDLDQGDVLNVIMHEIRRDQNRRGQ